MLERLKNAMRSPGDEKPPPRKTTEVRVDTLDPDPLERAMKHEPALVMLEGDLPGQVFRLRPGRQIIGRRPECDIRVRERAVSGIHAEVIRVRETVTINDLASTNGTLVNGMRIRTPVPLVQGTLVKLGNCVFRYVDSLLEVEFTEALHARGITDQLTGAFNKSYIVARLGFVIDLATESRPVSIITFDFDNFKQVNDQYGHAAGDHVLKATCALITDSFVRPTDLFARMGGEEFVIVLPETHDRASRRHRRAPPPHAGRHDVPIRRAGDPPHVLVRRLLRDQRRRATGIGSAPRRRAAVSLEARRAQSGYGVEG